MTINKEGNQAKGDDDIVASEDEEHGDERNGGQTAFMKLEGVGPIFLKLGISSFVEYVYVLGTDKNNLVPSFN